MMAGSVVVRPSGQGQRWILRCWQPMVTGINAWFAELDRFADVRFMEDGRHQPAMPPATNLFE